MHVLPIVARELRVGARRSSSYWLRAAAGAGAILAGIWWLMIARGQPAAEIGPPMFGFMGVVILLYTLLSGILFTADCLTREKREGTLGLLFLTDLNGLDIVLGKLAATSLGAVYGALAVIPILGVPLLIGGVTAGDFARMTLVILNTLFFSLTVGLAFSAVSRSGRRAEQATFWLVFGITAGPPIVWFVVESAGNFTGNWVWIMTPSPGVALFRAFDFAYRASKHTYWWSLGCVHLLAWLALACASLAAGRFWQDRPQPSRGSTEALGVVRGAPRRRRGELLEENPFLWLIAAGWRRPAVVWAVLAGCAGTWGAFYWRWRAEWLNPAVYFLTMVLLGWLMKFWLAAEVSRPLAEQRQGGTLELVLCTPLSVAEIMRGQALAAVRQFLGPGLVILGVLFCFLLAITRDVASAGDATLWAWVYLVGAGVALADMVAVYYVGMWLGLAAKSPQRAFLGTVMWVFLLPWVLMLGLGVVSSPQGEGEPYGWLAIWAGVSLVADLIAGSWAGTNLTNAFRATAAGRYSPKAGGGGASPQP